MALLALVAAVRPAVFTQTTGGLWEVSRPNGGRRNICLADPTVLAQYRAPAGELLARCDSQPGEPGGNPLHLPGRRVRPVERRAAYAAVAADRNAGNLGQCALPLRASGTKNWELLKKFRVPLSKGLTSMRLGRGCAGFGTLSSQSGLARNWAACPRTGGPSFVQSERLEGAAMTPMGSNDRKKAVVLLSGGLDSMVCAALAREQGFDVLALTVDYGQRHRVEIEAARRIAAAVADAAHRPAARPSGVRRFRADQRHRGARRTACSRAFRSPTSRRATSSSSAWRSAWAEAEGARDLFIGVNALDYSGYPDCRPDFVAAFEPLAGSRRRREPRASDFTIHAPLQHMTKADIAREADRLGLDAALSHSCYDPLPDGSHCGLCDACRLRSKGFAEAGCRIRRATRLRHDLCRQGMLPHPAGRGRAIGQPGRVPAVRRLQFVVRHGSRTAPPRSAISATPISSGRTGRAGASSRTPPSSPTMSRPVGRRRGSTGWS